MRRATFLGFLASVLLTLSMAGRAHADIPIVLENPNPRNTEDSYTIVNVNCRQPPIIVAIRGRSSTVVNVCGGIDLPGEVMITYAGESDTSALHVDRLHSWSVVELPERPMGGSLQTRQKLQEGQSEEDIQNPQ